MVSAAFFCHGYLSAVVTCCGFAGLLWVLGLPRFILVFGLLGDELERPQYKQNTKINNMLRAFTGSGLWLLVWGLWVKVSICWCLRQGAVGC